EVRSSKANPHPVSPKNGETRMGHPALCALGRLSGRRKTLPPTGRSKAVPEKSVEGAPSSSFRTLERQGGEVRSSKANPHPRLSKKRRDEGGAPVTPLTPAPGGIILKQQSISRDSCNRVAIIGFSTRCSRHSSLLCAKGSKLRSSWALPWPIWPKSAAPNCAS